MYLATPDGIPSITVEFDVVQANIPVLLSMDVLDREKLTPDTAFNRLAERQILILPGNKVAFAEDWYIPMRRSKNSHSCVRLVSTRTSSEVNFRQISGNFFTPRRTSCTKSC